MEDTGGTELVQAETLDQDSTLHTILNNQPNNSNTSSNNADTQIKMERKYSNTFPMHTATQKGKVEVLQKLLNEGDPFETDLKGRTPLHYACRFDRETIALKMVDVILSFLQAPNSIYDESRLKKLLNCKEKENGLTALHIAARTRHPTVVKKLLLSGADVNIKDNYDVKALKLIYSEVPTVMTAIFDTSVKCKMGDLDSDNPNLTLTFDFGRVIGEPEKKKMSFSRETKWLSRCLDISNKKWEILLHPVVQVFLLLKWKKMRCLYTFSFLYNVIWLASYAYVVTDVYLRICPYNPTGASNITQNSTDNIHNNSMGFSLNSTETFCDYEYELNGLNTNVQILIFLTFSILAKEVCQFFAGKRHYIRQKTNWFQLPFIFVVFTTIYLRQKSIVASKLHIYAYQYVMSAAGMMLASILMLIQISKIPFFGLGTYVLILLKVVERFFVVMLTFSSILIGFVISFHILMPQKQEFNSDPGSFLKTLVMMTGELNYDEVFYGEESFIPFHWPTKLLFAAFVVVVSIILFNLLIGLTVSDIRKLEDDAILQQHVLFVQELYAMEKFMVSKLVQNAMRFLLVRRLIRCLLVTQQHSDVKSNMKIDVPMSQIPEHLKREVRDLASRISVKKGGDQDDGLESICASKEAQRTNEIDTAATRRDY